MVSNEESTKRISIRVGMSLYRQSKVELAKQDLSFQSFLAQQLKKLVGMN